MSGWEYRLIAGNNNTQDNFNALGERGWEFRQIATIGAQTVSIFRRPAPVKRTGPITYAITKSANGNYVLSVIEQGEREEIESFAHIRPALAGLERAIRKQEWVFNASGNLVSGDKSDLDRLIGSNK